MTPTISVTETDHVPEDARVAHYDQLAESAKHALPDAVAAGEVDLPWTTAREFATIDVVKFTSYYRVAIPDIHPDADTTPAGATHRVPDHHADRDHPASGPLLD